MTQDNIGYAVVSPVGGYKSVLMTPSEVQQLPPECRNPPVERSPVCAPSRHSVAMPKGVMFYDGKHYKSVWEGNGSVHIGKLHFYADCQWLTRQAPKPVTAEMVAMLGISTCGKCSERLKRDMPEAELVMEAAGLATK